MKTGVSVLKKMKRMREEKEKDVLAEGSSYGPEELAPTS